MTRVQRLEQEIRQLNATELASLRKWFQEYDSAEWDKQIEEDALAGKLDRLAAKAIADHKAGRTREL